MFSQQNSTVLKLWAHKTDCKKSKEISVSPRNFYSLSLRVSGKVKFNAVGNNFVSNVGSITFMPAGVGYSTEVCEQSEMLLVHFTTLEPCFDEKPFSIDTDGNVEIQNMFVELVNSYRSGKENDYHCLSVLYSIMALLQRQLQFPQKKIIPKRMRLAKSYIDKNYNDDISIHSLAYASGISDVHFRNEFKKCYGYSPLEYIKKVRIDNAKLLLHSGYYSVSDVATMCGFESISYFSYEFKRLTGNTPREYINNEEIL